jgi:hypothetical protein
MDMNVFENDFFGQSFNINLNKIVLIFLKINNFFFEDYFKNILRIFPTK